MFSLMFKREFYTVLVELFFYNIFSKVDKCNRLRGCIPMQDIILPQILFKKHTKKVFVSGNKLRCKNVLLVRMIAVVGAQTANKSDQVFSS
jgi:hypothetical protein